MLGGAGQRTDCPQSPTDAHRSSARCVLEWCRSTKSYKPCNRYCLLGHRILYDVLFPSTRMGVKFSLLPVTKQPRCGISIAIKQCRLHRLDENLQINYMALRMNLNHLTPVKMSLHSMMVQSKQSTGLKPPTTAVSWLAAGTKHWRYHSSLYSCFSAWKHIQCFAFSSTPDRSFNKWNTIHL